MTDRYEFSVWAEGYATDAEGNLLDKDGNPVTDVPDEEQDDSAAPLGVDGDSA